VVHFPMLKLNAITNIKLTFGCMKNPRKHMVISVCIHGDEIAGLVAVNELITEGFFENGFDTEHDKVTVVIGNPQAVIEKKRFIDINLNRIFTPQFIHSNLQRDMTSQDLYEISRVREVVKEIEKCDVFLDLHSTSAPTIPFAIVTPGSESERIANTFPIGFVLHNVVEVVRGTSIEFAHSINKVAICVECGQHSERSSVDVAKNTIRAFVNENHSDRTPKQVLYVDKSEIMRTGFEFSKITKAFDRVEHKELIARDDIVGDIRCPYETGAYLIMPIANPVIGEEAWFWGHTTSRISS